MISLLPRGLGEAVFIKPQRDIKKSNFAPPQGGKGKGVAKKKISGSLPSIPRKNRHRKHAHAPDFRTFYDAGEKYIICPPPPQ